mgnify:CR=1 FL=1
MMRCTGDTGANLGGKVMNNWKSILKDARQISQAGIKTKLGTTPLTMGDENDCCEKLKNEVLGIMRNNQPVNTRAYTLMEGAFDSEETSCDEIVEYLEFSLKYDIGIEEQEYTHMLISKNEMKQAISNYYKCSFGVERYVV